VNLDNFFFKNERPGWRRDRYRIVKPVSEDSDHFFKGIRYGTSSIKIYKCEDESYLVVQKKYIFNYPYLVKRTVFNDRESAEDYTNTVLSMKRKYFSL
jgi:hypothetical protein